jgi:hypothetical protein
LLGVDAGRKRTRDAKAGSAAREKPENKGVGSLPRANAISRRRQKDWDGEASRLPASGDHAHGEGVRIEPDKATPLNGEAQPKDYLSKPAVKGKQAVRRG